MAHITHKPVRASWNLAVVHAFATGALTAPTAELLNRPRVRAPVPMKNWSEDADEHDWPEGEAERTEGGDAKMAATGEVARCRKKKQKIDGERVRQLKHLLPEKRPVVRNNKTQTKANDEQCEVARLAPRHRTQLADCGRLCDGTNQRAHDDVWGTWRKGRLLIEATGTRDGCFMQSRHAERTGEARQETCEGAIVISVGFSCRGP